jgi:hypothetical protein
LFNIFTISDRIIENFDNKDDELNPVDPYFGDNIAEGDQPLDTPENNAQTFLKIDNEYEKKFGRLYKIFDIRFLKGKIWESIDKVFI